MNLEMKKEYLRRIINASLNNKKYSTIIFSATFCLDEIKGILEELKKEFGIDNIIIIDFDFQKINSFFESNPTEEEIKNFIPKFPIPTGNTKIIYFDNARTDLSDNYYSENSGKYYKYLNEYNKEVFDKFYSLPRTDKTVVACPNKEWAEGALGSQDKLDELWEMVSKSLLSCDEEKKEIEERIRRKKELNRLGIHNLYFYTNLGTDFKIALNPHSIWLCEPNEIDGVLDFFNYPSYEIYTSPNCYSAEGKIVLSRKRRFYYDILIENATFNFSKGKLISCKSNSKKFDSVILNKPNKMNRIGEIALVSHSSPLAKSGKFYDSALFDENSGCHFALGNSIEECIGVDEEKIKEKGARYYRYNTSQYHTDLVFGDDSITVEAEKGKKKVLLMENGMWKI